MCAKRRGRINRQSHVARNYLEAEVADRACHRTAEDVRTTCSFARAERLLGREYHGRFLIELLQNAADATRSSDTAFERSGVVVRITEGPALLVANQGDPMGAEVVIESLGHIGAYTKAEGEAIGHKGIGFKSVLELTLTRQPLLLQPANPGAVSALDEVSEGGQPRQVARTARSRAQGNGGQGPRSGTRAHQRRSRVDPLRDREALLREREIRPRSLVAGRDVYDQEVEDLAESEIREGGF